MQQPKRFQAPTMSEAYDQVRRELGDSAVILSTRKAFAPGLFGQPGRQFVEVVARVPQEAPAVRAQAPSLDQDAAAHELVRALAEATASAPLGATGATRAAHAGFQRVASADDLPKRTREAAPAAREAARLPMPAATSDVPWSRQLDQMRTMLEQLVSERRDERIDNGPSAPRTLKERMLKHGVTPALVGSLLSEVDSNSARDEQSLSGAVKRRMAAMFAPPVTMSRRQRAIFLVGPGGAGKTTMAVRMALELQRQGLNAVIAGTDVSRAGAPQQLTAFGAVTGLDIRLCYAPGELEAILAEPGVDVVIVDTPGHNGLRRDRMAELSSFLQAARQRSVLLTVPATMKASDLSGVVSAFGALALDGAVLTRCDETADFGHLADVLIEAALGLAYMTRSDQVSDAPVPGDNLALAEAIVEGQWPAAAGTAASAPQRVTDDRPLAKVG